MLDSWVWTYILKEIELIPSFFRVRFALGPADGRSEYRVQYTHAGQIISKNDFWN